MEKMKKNIWFRSSRLKENSSRNIILFLIFIGISLLFIFPLVSAQDVFKQSEAVDIKVPCFNNNTYCSGTAACNITIIQPNRTTIINNKLMTNQATFHNYTLTAAQTALNGEYQRVVTCVDTNLNGFTSDNFIVTPTGQALDISSTLVYGLILLLMFGVTIFFLLFSNQTTSPPVKLFFNMVGYIVMFLTVGAGYVFVQSSGVQSLASDLVNALIFIVGIVLIIIMFFIFIHQTRQALDLMRAKKGFGGMETPSDYFN